METEQLYKVFEKESSPKITDEHVFTADALIEAHSLGKKEAWASFKSTIEGLAENILEGKLDEITNKVLDAERDKILNEVQSSFEKAIENSEKLFKFIGDNNFKCFSIYLKMDDLKTITSLILVDEKDWLSEKFDSVYDLSEVLEDAHIGINHSFIIMPKTDNFNENSVYSDGYKIKRNDG